MNKRSLFFIFFILTLSLPLFAQEHSKSVTAIEIKGNKSISVNKIMSQLKTQIGSAYQENIASDDLKRLYLTGYFSDVKIDTQDYKDGIKVIFTVSERPIIEKIAFTGSKQRVFKSDQLKESLRSKESQYLDYPKLAEDVKTLKNLYEKKGYGKVTIDYKTDIDKQTNKAKVEFNIDEGIRQRIRVIYVEGNTSFSDQRIRRLIKTKSAWFFNPGVLKEEVLKEDIERIKTFYHKEGFIDADVDYEYKTDPKARFIYLTLKITEGKKYLVGSLTIRGNKDITEEDILAKIKECAPGKIFSREALKQDILSVQGLYFDRGYISAYVQDITSLNTYTGRIDIVLNITESEIAYVDKIKIRGNVKTKDVVIRRELRIRPGDRFDGGKLRRGKERLQNLGFFEEVSYDTEDTAVPNKKDLVVDVKETKTGMFSFGGGYSTVDHFVGFAEIEQKNFDWKNWPYFTGGGQDLKLRASTGSFTQGFDLSFTEPWIMGYPLSFGFDLYNSSHKRDSDVGYGYDEEVTGGDLRLGKEISEYLRADLTYRYDNIDISDISENASGDLKDEAGKNTISSTELGLTYDSRDNVFNPTKGNVLGGSIQVAGGPFGGDKDFWKFFGRVSHYFPLFTGSVFEMRVRVGIADTYSESKSNKIPIYDRFFAGGAYSIRGYRERKIGPIDPVSGDPLGGNSLFIGNLEYTYPLMSFFKLAAFYDVGNVWSKTNDFGSGGLKSGAGVGFRLKTPIGPVMLDYGIPLNKAPGEDRKGGGRFHFSMSHGF
jgi:outer membrane protein insertion porin family